MNNKKTISLILGLMCLLLTYGIIVQFKTINTTGSTVSTNAEENQLRDAVLKQKEKYDNLLERITEAEKELENERTNATQNNGELSELENTIKEGNKALGLTEVKGKGVIVTLDDNKDISLSEWYLDPNLLLIHDTDIISVVNELKNAGAEAISINDQRIVTTSAIECDGNVIKINDTKINAPFIIKAIGFPESLVSVGRTGGCLDYMKERFVTAKVEKSEDDIIIPKYTGVIKFNYAESR